MQIHVGTAGHAITGCERKVENTEIRISNERPLYSTPPKRILL
ncbi:uncharacterized protein G2W53_034742 [Senna tora]|uniref:Uncharacterized protein n=1 Tax=Senna tora TaxID=362788 RepID=A0A834T3V8_9FABA|nr:uncharacterized protein G2W53_034742 [Senna tora]